MKELDSYSIDELEQLTGTNRRTISYYITEGLLPKVGRRGPKTRYGREFVERLKFIQRVKDLQDAGKLPSVTLSDIGLLMGRLTDEEIAEGSRSQKRLQEIFAEGMGAAAAAPAGPDAYVADNFADYSAADELGGEVWSRSFAVVDPGPEPGDIARASRRRDMYKLRSRSSPVEDAAPMSIESPMRSEAPAPDMFDQTLSTTRAEAERSMEQIAGVHREVGAVAEDVTSLRDQLRQIREETRTDLQDMQMLAREVTELRHLVRTEMNGLRESLDELTTLRQRTTGDDDRVRQARLQNRARIWARRAGLPTQVLRVATLRTNPERPGRQVWEFPIDIKMLGMGADLTLLLERRHADGSEDGFVALQVPLPDLAEMTRPLFKFAKGIHTKCVISAAPDDYLLGINCPGLDLGAYVHAERID